MRQLAVLIVAALFTTGCFPHRAFKYESRALGEAEVVDTTFEPSAPQAQVVASDRTTVTLEVRVYQVPVEHREQQFKVWELGEYPKEDSQRAAVAWGLGGLLAGTLALGVPGPTAPDGTPEPNGKAALAVFGAFAVPTTWYAVAPPRKRGRKKETRQSQVHLDEVPSVGAVVELSDPQGETLGSWSSDDEGRVRADLSFEHGTVPRKVAASVNDFDVPIDLVATQTFDDVVVRPALERALNLAAAGDGVGAAEATAIIPVRHSSKAEGDRLIRCASTVSEPDPLRAWSELKKLAKEGEAATLRCVEAVRQLRRQEYEVAFADWERKQAEQEAIEAAEWEEDERLAEKERAQREAVQAAYLEFFPDNPRNLKELVWCRILASQGLNECDAGKTSRLAAMWCSENWNAAVKAGGKAAARNVRADYCGDSNNAHAITNFRTGKSVTWTAKNCTAVMRSWCD